MVLKKNNFIDIFKNVELTINGNFINYFLVGEYFNLFKENNF